MKRRRFWGWGWEDEGPTPEQQGRIAEVLAVRLGIPVPAAIPPPRIDEIELRPPRVEAPARLAEVCSAAPYDRAGHSYGKSFRDIVRGFRRDFRNPPDCVAYPRDEDDIVALLDWCDRERIAVIPYGGGSSVVGGVEPCVGEGYRAAVSIDLSKLDRVVEIDRASRAARIQAGVLGPSLEDQLRPHGLTLRHFPQSFELSSLGGWIATRSGGHYATLYTHIDDMVESLRVVTPTGLLATRRLPGSGAGPSPDRLLIGSEGILGIITEAWMRLQDRPKFRNATAITFAGFDDAVAAVHAISQSGLHPTNCRLLDAGEAGMTGAGSGEEAVLLLAFESADHSLDPWMARGLEICRSHRGVAPPDAGTTRVDSDAGREGSAGAWRQAFLGGPYLRDALVGLGMISETFETAVTWDRFADFHAAVMDRVRRSVVEICGGGTVTCRFTHVYPDGPAPYYTVIAPSRPDSQIEQWAEIKAVASEALLAHGGTITHHHAVGRDHRPWYDQQRPPLFAQALQAAKAAVDPNAILNPQVLIDPLPPSRRTS